uniref:MHC class II antigen beta chain 2 n=1 Tax=Andrias davidianus TaxID=141262 RepID=V9QMZ5_ANDDA|nr:MHC class II antigen beta chain 2 [Andrias davidianus]
MSVPWVPGSWWIGALLVTLAGLGTQITHCRDTPADFVTQAKSECHFLDGTERVRFLERYSYNQEELVYFDSDVGRYVPKTELGKPAADQWNNNPAILEQKRANVERYCKYNYQVAEQGAMVHRRVKPTVKVSLMKAEDVQHPHMLICTVYGFYPSTITVRWFKNGQEDPGVVSSALLQNGDWTSQILVMLETSIQHRDTFVCQVEHVSLPEPISVEWKLEASESARSKMLTGIVGFVLGGIFIIVGVVIYMKNKKARPQFGNHLPEESDLMN